MTNKPGKNTPPRKPRLPRPSLIERLDPLPPPVTREEFENLQANVNTFNAQLRDFEQRTAKGQKLLMDGIKQVHEGLSQEGVGLANRLTKVENGQTHTEQAIAETRRHPPVVVKVGTLWWLIASEFALAAAYWMYTYPQNLINLVTK